MSLVAFAAARSARLDSFADEIRGIVESALGNYGGATWWTPIAEGAAVLWSEIFERESPTGQSDGPARERFLREIGEHLAKTAEPSDPPTEGEINRVVNWVGVYTVNSATYWAGRDAEDNQKVWLSMDDESVRPAHRAVDGQTVPIMGTFDVGGHKLHFPGEPVGPPEVWINCRCLLAVTGGPEMGTKITSFAANAGEDVEEIDGEPLLEAEPGAEEAVDTAEMPWHGVLVVEGTPTGDKRQFDEGSLSYADFPLPITYQRASADGHGGSVVVGRIDKIWKDEGSNEHRATGMFNLNVPEANEVVDGIVFGMLGGVSVDVDSTDFTLEYDETAEGDEESNPFELMFGGNVKLTHFTAGRIRSASIVSIPAFAEAYVALGPDFDEDLRDPKAGTGDADLGEVAAGAQDSDSFSSEDDDEVDEALQKLLDGIEAEDGALVASAYVDFAPGTRDGPGWITHPRATQRLRTYWVHGKGAAKIRWGVPGDFNRCRRQLAKYVNPAFLAGTCANLHKEALKVWPGRERGQGKGPVGDKKNESAAAPAFNLIASAAAEQVDSGYFSRLEFNRITPITVEEDGHVFGHLAVWGTCHIGIDGICTMPPASETQYAFFATGQVLTTGGFVNTGRITLGTGHAGTRAALGDARAHYDNTGRAVADVAVWEDGIGIAFSGRIREDATPADVKALRASALSGDWRRTSRGGLELIGMLAVNAGGYPTPRFAMDGDQQVSLIASAGAIRPASEVKSVTAGAYFDNVDDLLALGRVVADELEYRQERRARLSTIRDPEILEAANARRAERIAAARTLGE